MVKKYRPVGIFHKFRRLFEPENLKMLPDYFHPKTMESKNINLFPRLPDVAAQSLLHGIHSGIGKSEAQDSVRLDIGLCQNIGNAERENLRLARARARHHHYWSVYRVYGFFLGLIELFVFFRKYLRSHTDILTLFSCFLLRCFPVKLRAVRFRFRLSGPDYPILMVSRRINGIKFQIL